MQTTITYGDPKEIAVFEEKTYKEQIKENSVTYKDYKEYDAVTKLSPNTIYKAKYIDSTKNEYVFDIGHKSNITVPKNLEENGFLSNIKMGEFIELYITKYEDDDDKYNIIGSVVAAKQAQAHQELSEMNHNDFVIANIKELTSAGYNAAISIAGVELEAFMPNILAGVNKLLDFQKGELVGRMLEVCILGFSDEKGTYIISRKAYLQKLIPVKIRELKRDFVYTGKVTGTSDFGIFVEFEEFLTGMIHKTAINPEYRDIIDTIEEGTEIDFYVKEIIKDKIILTQILEETLWDTLQIGQVVDGKIKSVSNFGILVMLDAETSGMIKKNEIKDISKYNEGDKITIRILYVDKNSRKIYLSDNI